MVSGAGQIPLVDYLVLDDGEPHLIAQECSSCGARIKAPFELLGHKRRCPGCKTMLAILPQPPEDEGPVLVLNFEQPLSQRRFAI